MELRQLDQWRGNLDAMDYAIRKTTAKKLKQTLKDNRTMLAKLFEESGIEGATLYEKGMK